ncbi:MAG: hypothetical protein ABIV11_05310 [Gemmatimonadaceae bacterium]
MANSNWDKEDAGRTSSSREESGAMEGAGGSSENQGDGFETGNARQGGSGGGGGQQGGGSGGSGGSSGGQGGSGGGANKGGGMGASDTGLDKSRERIADEPDSSSRSGGMSGSSGSTGLGGETSKEESGSGGVEGTSPRGGGSDPDRTSQT